MTEVQEARAQTKPELAKIRTDVVGSLLRPATVKEARIAFDDGKIDADELHAIEDEAVREAVRLQEDAGLDVVTDGEMRRLNFQDSFGASVEGYDAEPLDAESLRAAGRRLGAAVQRWDIPQMQDAGTAVSHRRPAKARLRLAHNIPLEEYRFVSKRREEAGEGVADRAGPDFAALRLRKLDRGLSRHGRFSRRRRRDRAADRVEPGRGRLPLRAYRCAGLHGLCRRAVAGADARRAAKIRWQNFARSLKAEAAVVADFPASPSASICAAATSAACGTAKAPTMPSPSGCSTSCRTTASCSNTTRRAPAVSRRCASCRRARWWCSAWSAPRWRSWKRSTRSSGGSTRRAKFIPLDQLAISPAMRLCLRRGRQSAQRRRSEAQAGSRVETARQVWG